MHRPSEYLRFVLVIAVALLGISESRPEPPGAAAALFDGQSLLDGFATRGRRRRSLLDDEESVQAVFLDDQSEDEDHSSLLSEQDDRGDIERVRRQTAAADALTAVEDPEPSDSGPEDENEVADAEEDTGSPEDMGDDEGPPKEEALLREGDPLKNGVPLKVGVP